MWKVGGLTFVFSAVFVVLALLWFYRGEDNFAAPFTGMNILKTAAYFLSVFVSLLCVFLYMRFGEKGKEYPSLKSCILLYTVITVTALLCLIALDYLNIFAVPLALVATLLRVLVRRDVSLTAVVFTALILFVSYVVNDAVTSVSLMNAVIAVISATFSACFTLFLISKKFTRMKFIVMGLLGGVVALPVTALLLLIIGESSLMLLTYLFWSYVGHAAAIVLFMFLLPVFESVFNIADDFRLDEICNLRHPLLKKLANEASGTFNHSQSVAILAENCAIAMGENPHLARAAAYYHDVGKLKDPLYFVENQSNKNPHDDLLPELSVSIITGHTTFGAELCRQYKIPKVITDIVRQHHGDTIVNFFYMKANKISGSELSYNNFRYPGPRPTTKIAAIIMIADSIEAASRVTIPDTQEKLEEYVDGFIKDKMEWRQFDNCPITMRELGIIKRSIAETLPGIRHGRIAYKK